MNVGIGKHILRPATEKDRELIAQWIEGDPDHRGRVTPDFFLGKQPGKGERKRDIKGQECFAVEDLNGHVVFYIKMTRTLRLDIQFGPAGTIAEKQRNADALDGGFEWLRIAAAGSGIWEINFNSTNRPLTRYAERRLAFRKAPNELSHRVAALHSQTSEEKQAQR
jgi:hypothetical protein